MLKNPTATSVGNNLVAPWTFTLSGLYELPKPRLSLLSVFTASLGYLLHDPLLSDLSKYLNKLNEAYELIFSNMKNVIKLNTSRDKEITKKDLLEKLKTIFATHD